MNHSPELQAAMDAAEQAADIARSLYQHNLAVRIKADPSAMATRGLSVENLAAAIGAGTPYQGAGQLDGATVHLRDVAQVRDGLVDERLSMRFWARGVKVPSATVVTMRSRSHLCPRSAWLRSCQSIR